MFWIIFGCSAAALAVAALIIYIIYGNQVIRVSRHEVRLDLPEAFDGFRVSHVSDLHNKNYGKGARRLMDKIRAERPQIIVISGDIIHTEHYAHALDFVREAAALCPVFYVNGNHEKPLKCYEPFRARMIDAGVRVLDNEVVRLLPDGSLASDETLAADGAKPAQAVSSASGMAGADGGSVRTLALAGIQDPVFFGNKSVRYERFDETLAALRKEAGSPAMLLCHRPELIDRYAAAGFELVFTGHAHGGQVRFPFVGAVYAPNQSFMPKLVEGIHVRGETTELISRGLGSSNPVPRFHNNPELITLIVRTKQNS